MSAVDLALQQVADEVRRIAVPSDISRWLHAAKAGDRLHYATRSYLPAGAPGPMLLRTLSDQRLVMLVRKRSDLLLNEFCYFAVRTSVAIPTKDASTEMATRGRLSTRNVDSGDYAAGDALLPILTRAAQFGRPCPTDKQLAERGGIAVERVQPGLDALRTAKWIAVHAAPAPTLRRVTILSTGAQTGLAA